jgi:hypothetical protein
MRTQPVPKPQPAYARFSDMRFNSWRDMPKAERLLIYGLIMIFFLISFLILN